MSVALSTALPHPSASTSPTAAADTAALFEFDAPQLYVDLRAAGAAASARDPWFDELHEAHSRPSAELARELALEKHKEQRQRRDKEREESQERQQSKRQLSPGSEKENRGERRPATDRAQGARKFLTLREARATQEPFQVGRSKAVVHSVAAPSSAQKRTRGLASGDKQHSGRPSDPAATPTPKRRRPLGTLAIAKAKAIDGATETTRRPGRKPNAPSQTKSQSPSQLKPHQQLKRPRPRDAAPDADMRELKALLARHNKKFKAAQHTYEPPKHSVRDIKSWERETKQSFYALSVEERHRANEEIAQWLKERREAKLERVGAR